MAVTIIENDRVPAPSFESRRLFSRIEKILKDAGIKITGQGHEDPESFYKRVKGTPSYNDSNGFFEIDGGDSYIDIYGFSNDEFSSPSVTVQGTLDDSIVNIIKKSVNSVEGWEFDSQMVSKITESPQKEKRQFSYRGYIIRKRESDGESLYDIINPKVDKKTPVWTDCGSVDEAKLWINSDKAGKLESLSESQSDEFYQPTKEEASAIISRIKRKYGNEITEQDYLQIISDVLSVDNVYTDIIDFEREKAGIKIIGESLIEGKSKNWSVKHFTFDAAIHGESADSLGLSAGGHGKFFNDLCEFLAEHGMEMAGDYIDAEDVTDIYKDNDYEFFQSE